MVFSKNIVTERSKVTGKTTKNDKSKEKLKTEAEKK
jgi:hypothetical protein